LDNSETDAFFPLSLPTFETRVPRITCFVSRFYGEGNCRSFCGAYRGRTQLCPAAFFCDSCPSPNEVSAPLWCTRFFRRWMTRACWVPRLVSLALPTKNQNTLSHLTDDDKGSRRDSRNSRGSRNTADDSTSRSTGSRGKRTVVSSSGHMHIHYRGDGV